VQPDISIIVFASNGPDVLFRCLESLLNQTFPTDKTELIIIDDNNDQRLGQSLKAGECNKFLNFKYIPLLKKGPVSSRNAGIQNVSSGLIAFINDDCIADCDWIKWILEAHRVNPDKTVIGGLTYVSQRENTSLVSQFLNFRIIEYGLDKKEIVFLPVCNVSIKKQVFSKHLFNEGFSFYGGDDREFFWRIFNQGERFLLEQNIKVVRSPIPGLVSFLRQAYYCGRSSLLTAYLHQGHPQLKGISTGKFSFWLANLCSFLGIVVFSYSTSRELTRQEAIRTFSRKISIYLLVILYRAAYLWGNVCEFCKKKV